MKLTWDEVAWEHYQHWIATDPTVLRKINGLLKECLRTPFAGTGKPEALKGKYRGHWSRRITHEHRLVYRVEAEAIVVVLCRFHYDD
jgi:toxin YoeB